MSSGCQDRVVFEGRVILVDEQNRVIGEAEKLRAHQDGGLLHRAFSVFVFDARGRLLLQKRSQQKYHFGSLWSNTCCSHPRPGEDLAKAACRRLLEEMGFSTPLREVAQFFYQAIDARSGLTEREWDHVLMGMYNHNPLVNPLEVDDWRWVDFQSLQKDLAERSDTFTPWFSLACNTLEQKRLWPR